MTSCQRYVASLMASLRDSHMTTHFGPLFRRENTLDAFLNHCKQRSNEILRSSGWYGNSAEKTAACTDGLICIAGPTERNGGFRLDVLNAPQISHEFWFSHACVNGQGTCFRHLSGLSRLAPGDGAARRGMSGTWRPERACIVTRAIGREISPWGRWPVPLVVRSRTLNAMAAGPPLGQPSRP